MLMASQVAELALPGSNQPTHCTVQIWHGSTAEVGIRMYDNPICRYTNVVEIMMRAAASAASNCELFSQQVAQGIVPVLAKT
jgi:hypothetical protein